MELIIMILSLACVGWSLMILRKAKRKVDVQDGATRYIIDAKNREVRGMTQKMEESELINSQRIRVLEMYIGYLHQKYKLKSFRLGKVREFGLKYEALFRIPDLEDDLVVVEIKEKQDDPDLN